MKRLLNFINKVIHFFIPTPGWQLIALLLFGVFVGISIYIFYVSNAGAYLSDDPKTCINCHVMVPQYASWKRSSHAHVATCVDCHVPHDNIFHKYEFKMKDGLRHAAIFTLHQEPQVIRIKPAGAEVVQQNCIHCHENVLSDVSIHQVTYKDYIKGEAKLCWECHRETPHGRVRSLSAAPYANVPELPSIIPPWFEPMIPVIDKFLNIKEEKKDEKDF